MNDIHSLELDALPVRSATNLNKLIPEMSTSAVAQEEDVQDFTLQTHALMASDEDEDWASRRESAPIMDKAVASSQIVQETPPNYTNVGGAGVMETAETYKLSGSEAGYVTGRGGAEGMLESVQDFGGVHNEPAIDDQQIEAEFAEPQSNRSYYDAKDQEDHSPYERQQTHQSSKRNYIDDNASHIKTFREIKNANSEKRKVRVTEKASRNHMNPWGYKFFGITENSRGLQGFQTSYRSQDWGKVLILNSQAEKLVNKHSEIKNQSNNIKLEVPEIATRPNQGFSLAFAGSQKEKAWQKTNQSSINMLYSFKTLDLPDKGEEAPLVPQAQGNVMLASNLNRKSQLDQTSHGRIVEIPEEFITFKPKSEVIHNINNEHVMNGRKRTYTSQVL